jgi:plasmid stabilization system protein ParE
MRVSVLPQAANEFAEAVGYYEQQQPGLGGRFRDEVGRHIRWISEHAEIPRVRPGGYRRVNLRVFPHFIAYLVKADTVWVLAIAHGHRKPEYWIGRA